MRHLLLHRLAVVGFFLCSALFRRTFFLWLRLPLPAAAATLFWFLFLFRFLLCILLLSSRFVGIFTLASFTLLCLLFALSFAAFFGALTTSGGNFAALFGTVSRFSYRVYCRIFLVASSLLTS